MSVARFAGSGFSREPYPRVIPTCRTRSPGATICRPEASGLFDTDIHVGELLSWRISISATEQLVLRERRERVS